MKQCPNCRRMVSDDSMFCSICGARIDDSNNSDNNYESYTAEDEAADKRNYIIAGILVFVFIVFMGILINGSDDDSSSKSSGGIMTSITGYRCQRLVKTGSLLMYPDAEIGKAFDSFFTNGEWRYFVSTEDKKIVEYKGGCRRNNKDVTLTIQFVVDLDSKTFTLDYMGIGKSGFTEYDMWDVMDTVMDNYYKTGS